MELAYAQTATNCPARASYTLSTGIKPYKDGRLLVYYEPVVRNLTLFYNS